MAKETALTVNQVVVAAAGTAKLLMAIDDADIVLIVKALPTNSGYIYLGNSDVDSSNGFVLSKNEQIPITLRRGQLDIYIDASNTGEGVSYIYYNN